jgi:hemoglobin
MSASSSAADGNSSGLLFSPYATLDQTSTHYELLGGEPGIRTLVDRFYDLMESSPEAVHVRALHATSLKQSREKLFLYLMGWTGGPPTYVERFGHPRLRQRHMPFAIGARERDEWLWCMKRALDAHDVDGETRVLLWQRLMQLADFMRNQPDETTGGLQVL